MTKQRPPRIRVQNRAQSSSPPPSAGPEKSKSARKDDDDPPIEPAMQDAPPHTKPRLGASCKLPDPALSSESDDEVGYKKPPKKNRFKKGQSGNPSGKKKLKKRHPGNQIDGVSRAMFRELNDLLTDEGPTKPVTGKFWRARQFARIMLDAAGEGDKWARREIWEFYVGRRTDSDLFKKKDGSTAGAEMLATMARAMFDPTITPDAMEELVKEQLEIREQFDNDNDEED